MEETAMNSASEETKIPVGGDDGGDAPAGEQASEVEAMPADGLMEELERLRAEIREKDDKYLRLFAEFDNFRRRNARERIELIQTAGREVIQSLLEVLDDCDRAERMMHGSADLEAVGSGVQLVFNKLRGTLQSKGLRELKSAGEPFDTDLHEAITEVPVADAAQEGRIIDVLEKGYYLNDKLIRFAKVVVGKHSS